MVYINICFPFSNLIINCFILVQIPRVELETRCLQLYVVILPRREHRYEFRQPADVPPDGILRSATCRLSQ